MKTVAFTIAYGKGAVSSARLLRATFKAVHPEVPFFVVDEALWPFFARQAEPSHTGEIISLRTLAGHFLALCFDRVVYFDADVLLLAPVPRLVEQRPGDPPVLVTRDRASFDYSLPDHPLINAGVLASSQPDFWATWAMTIYSSATRVIENFFDQFSLRLLAHQQAFPHRLLPGGKEKEADQEHYNVSCLDSPGEWRREEEAVFKGEARVFVWHWAGYGKKPTPIHLPPPVRNVVMALLARSRLMELAPYEEENRCLHALIAEEGRGAAFHAHVEKLFAELPPLQCYDDLTFHEQAPPAGLFSCDAPAGWEPFRVMPPGLHRRLLTRTPRYLYAWSEARLHEADVEEIDRPFGAISPDPGGV